MNVPFPCAREDVDIAGIFLHSKFWLETERKVEENET
jgi:hypothetical protein